MGASWFNNGPEWRLMWLWFTHHNDVIMGTIATQITSLTVVCSTVYSDADQTKHQNSASLAFVRGIHRGPVNSPNKWPVTGKMFPFDDVIMHANPGHWPALCAGLLCCNFFNILTPVPYHHFFSSLILLFIYIYSLSFFTWCIWCINWSCWQSYITLYVLMF